MKRLNPNLLSSKIPLIFTDGTYLYNKLAKECITHKMGFFVLAPSGAGKTHFINHQKEKHWIDGDKLWEAANAHPKEKWWLSNKLINETDPKSDVITVQAKKRGFWIMGASNSWLKPDAIVIPRWTTHKKYIRIRETTNYDGGAKSDKLQGVLNHRKFIMQWVKKGVPKFSSIEKAVNYLVSIYKESISSKI